MSTPSDPSLARDRLVAATRSLMRAVGTTDLSPDEMMRAAERLEQLTPDLGRHQLSRVPVRPYAESVGAHTYAAAAHNPGMVPVDIEFLDDRARARVVLDALAEGPRDCAHGGIISYLMDTLLACLVQQQGHLCVTASLTIDYRARTPLHAPLELEARITEVRARSLVVVGTITHESQVTVEATGLFVAVPQR